MIYYGPYLLGYGTWYGTSRSTIPKPKEGYITVCMVGTSTILHPSSRIIDTPKIMSWVVDIEKPSDIIFVPLKNFYFIIKGSSSCFFDNNLLLYRRATCC